MTPPKLPYRPDIDGLRAVAVMSVVLCHGDLGLPGGFVGVDVFFVISGYLITALICQDIAAGKGLMEFWERRIRRILPALVVVVAASIFMGWLLFLRKPFVELGNSVTALAALVSNVYFFHTTNYFAAGAEEQPLLHTWSLAVEEQFYLLMPLVLWLLSRQRRLQYAAGWLTVIAVCSFINSVFGSIHRPAAAFYLLPSRAWELLAGAILSFQVITGKPRDHRLRGWTSLVGLMLILFSCWAYDGHTRFPGIAALLPVLGTLLFIWSGSSPGILPAPNRVLALRLPVFVGRISYSTYLWHWPLFTFAQYQSTTPLTSIQRVGLVLLSLAIGGISWWSVEMPVRDRRVFAMRGPLMLFAAASLSGLLLCGNLLQRGIVISRLTPEEVSRHAHFVKTSEWSERFFKNHNAVDVPSRLTCFGDGRTVPEILVWGDSHAMAILSGIDDLCRKSHISAVAATHGATAPAIGYFVQAKGGLNERAIPFNDAVLDFACSGQIHCVLLAGSWADYGALGSQQLIDALLRTVESLRDAGVTVFFLKDVPHFYVDPARVLSVHEPEKALVTQLAMTTEEYESQNSVQAQLLPLLRQTGVVILDPVPNLQAKANSNLIVPCDEDGLFFHDKHHLSTYGALAIRDVFAPLIRQAIESH